MTERLRIEAVLRWIAGWVEAFLWRVEYHASQWADALNRRFT